VDLVELALDSSQHVAALVAAAVAADVARQVEGCSSCVHQDHMTPLETQNVRGTTVSALNAHALAGNSGQSQHCHSPLDLSLCCSRSFAPCCSWRPGGDTPL